MVKVGLSARPRLNRGLCLTHPAKMRLGGGEKEMRIGIISIGIDRPEQPNGGFLVAAENELCEADGRHPTVGNRVAWAKAQRF